MKYKLPLMLLLISASAAGQYSHGYVYIAPGGLTSSYGSFSATASTLQSGVGGEWVSRIGVGAGAEISYLAPTASLGDGMGVASVNGSYHFLRRRKLDPFATAGYSLGFRSGTINMFNFGGGVNYWIASHLGVKVEFRDHVYTGSGTSHFWGFRFGVNFR